MSIQKSGIFLIICICFMLMSCTGNPTSNIKKETVKIPSEDITVIHEEDLPFQYDSFMLLSDGRYIFKKLIGEEQHLYLFEEKSGLVAETVLSEEIALASYQQDLIYDETNDLILVTIARNAEPLDEEGYESILIALNMELEEQWRIDIPLRLYNVCMKNDLYFAFSEKRNSASRWQEPTTKYDCLVTKISAQGEVLRTYTNDNFFCLGSVLQDEKLIFFGMRGGNNQSEAVIMKEDDLNFFSDDIIILENQDGFVIEYVKGDLAVISGSRGTTVDDSKYYLSTFDVPDMRILNTIDISDIMLTYGLGSGYTSVIAEKDGDMVMLGTPRYTSELNEAGVDLLLISIDQKGEINKVIPMDVGEYPYLFISNGDQDGESFHIVLYYWDFIYEEDPGVILKIDVSKSLIME